LAALQIQTLLLSAKYNVVMFGEYKIYQDVQIYFGNNLHFGKLEAHKNLMNVVTIYKTVNELYIVK